MNGLRYLDLLMAFGSEIVLAVAALVALTLDLVFLRRQDVRVRTRDAGVVAIIGALAAFIPLTQQLDPIQLPGGTLVVSQLTVIFKLVILALTAFVALLSMHTDVGRHVGEYFALLLLGAIGMLLLVSAEELITIFVALELTSISLYVLTAFHKERLRSQEAALKYFVFGAIASAFLLFGLSYVYGVTGKTNLRALYELAAPMDPLLVVGMLFVVVGLGFKIAVAPFHLWAPDAYEGAPTPVAAFIATGSKVASFVVLLKVLYLGFPSGVGTPFWGHVVSGWAPWLAVIATVSMVLGNCAAIVQRNLKRLLAYSSIAHAGYVLVALAAANVMGAAAVLYYAIAYALSNLGAFGILVALADRAGGEEIANFRGMARRAPYLSLLMLVFLLSLAGIPPLAGFFGKFFLFAAAVGRDTAGFGLLWLVIVAIVMSAVSLYYYLVVLKAFYVETGADTTRIRTPFSLNVGLTLLALAVILLGIFPQPILALLNGLVVRL